MQALLEVKKGEQTYKAAQSQWLSDDDGPVCFRMISKKRKDGQIEMVFYSLREDGLKRIIQHISFDEKDFYQIVSLMEETMRRFFPEMKLETENIDMSGGSNCRIEVISTEGSYILAKKKQKTD